MAQHEILAALLGFPGACVELRRKLSAPGRESQSGSGTSGPPATLVFSENVRVLADWERDAAGVALATGTAYLRILSLLGDSHHAVACSSFGKGEVKRKDMLMFEPGTELENHNDGLLQPRGLYLTALREAVETELDTYRHAVAALEQVGSSSAPMMPEVLAPAARDRNSTTPTNHRSTRSRPNSQELLREATLPLSHLHRRLRPFSALLPKLESLLRCVDSHGLRGCQIVGFLQEASAASGDPLIRMAVMRALCRCQSVLCSQLRSWLSYGVLWDPFGEFFVEEREVRFCSTVSAAATATVAGAAGGAPGFGARDSNGVTLFAHAGGASGVLGSLDYGYGHVEEDDAATASSAAPSSALSYEHEWETRFVLRLSMLPTGLVSTSVAQRILFVGKAARVLGRASRRPVKTTGAPVSVADDVVEPWNAEAVAEAVVELARSMWVGEMGYSENGNVRSCVPMAASKLEAVVASMYSDVTSALHAELLGLSGGRSFPLLPSQLATLREFFLMGRGEFFHSFVEHSRPMLALPPSAHAEYDIRHGAWQAAAAQLGMSAADGRNGATEVSAWGARWRGGGNGGRRGAQSRESSVRSAFVHRCMERAPPSAMSLVQIVLLREEFAYTASPGPGQWHSWRPEWRPASSTTAGAVAVGSAVSASRPPMTLVGSGAVELPRRCICLCPDNCGGSAARAAAVWFPDKQPVARGFSAATRFFMPRPGAGRAKDGAEESGHSLAFVIQNGSATTLPVRTTAIRSRRAVGRGERTQEEQQVRLSLCPNSVTVEVRVLPQRHAEAGRGTRDESAEDVDVLCLRILGSSLLNVAGVRQNAIFAEKRVALPRPRVTASTPWQSVALELRVTYGALDSAAAAAEMSSVGSDSSAAPSTFLRASVVASSDPPTTTTCTVSHTVDVRHAVTLDSATGAAWVGLTATVGPTATAAPAPPGSAASPRRVVVERFGFAAGPALPSGSDVRVGGAMPSTGGAGSVAAITSAALPRSAARRTVAAWDGLSLRLQLRWPLHLVITQSALRRYNTVFRSLFRLKRVGFELERAWASMMHANRKAMAEARAARRRVRGHGVGGVGGVAFSFGGGGGAPVATMWRLRSAMTFLVQTLQYYFQVDVVDVEYARLTEAVAATCGQADGFDRLRRAHEGFLAAVGRRSFLHVRSAQRAISSVLDTCLEFCALTGRTSHQLPSRRLAGKELADAVSRLERNYCSEACYLFLVLSGVDASLLLRLDFNGYHTVLSKNGGVPLSGSGRRVGREEHVWEK